MHPTPPTLLIQLPPQRLTIFTSEESYIITWNASSFNTTMSCLHDLATYSQTPPIAITIQETKLTATKSTKHIQNLFLHYKFLFNNTYNITRIMRQRMTHRGYKGELLTLIHNKHAFLGNLSKIPTLADISPFLQIICIANQPLQPWLLINIYNPSHDEDLPFIPTIQNTIIDQINVHPDHTHILCGGANRDIALLGRQNDQLTLPPQTEDY